MSTAGQSKTAMRAVDSATRHRILEVSRRVSATIGTEFFHAIAKHLAAALGADCVIVAEFLAGHMERCRSLGAWADGAPAEFEYELAGSAMSQVAVGKPCQLRTHAQKHFPADPLLWKFSAEACIGVPLLADGNPVGALMAIYRRSVPSLHFAKEILTIFSGRAAAELVREIEEQKLRESDQRYRAFIAKNSDALWRVEFERPIPIDLPEEEQYNRILQYGYLAECNEALARLLGVSSPDQLIGSRIKELTTDDPTTRNATMEAIRSRYTQTSVETARLDKHGNRKSMLRSQWGIVEDGQLRRIWGSNRDITALRHTELALSASERRMADLIESVRLLVVFLDLNGWIEFCNQYLLEVTGWPPEELIGKDWLSTLVPASERGRVAAEFERNAPDRPVHFDSGMLVKGGSLHVEWDCTILRDSTGKAGARALVGRNITEQKALQDQVLQAQKLAGIGRLAGGLAHDFNNQLTIILGYASKIMGQLKPTDAAFHSLAQIQTAAERSAELAHRLLAFSRREVFRPQVVDLNSLVESLRGPIETLTGDFIRVELDLEPDLRPVRLDPDHFHHALLNLAANARDAMPEGGLLAIATSNIDLAHDDPHYPGIPNGGYVLVTVADTGSGMTAEVKSHLFEPFFTTKERGKGTGLGLAMVYGIVQRSSGQIRVDSEPDRGTTIRIFLPYAANAKAQQPARLVHALPQGSETVLLVEGPYSRGATAARVLSDLGYTVLQADGPERALEISREKTGGIQLMLSPEVSEGMPGEVLLNLVREFQPKILALFVSARGEQSSRAENAAGGANGFLPSSFSRKALALKVREVLDANHPHD
jgi:PAS domain S-box-containing protein